MIHLIKKRDGKIDRFDQDRIRKAISKAAGNVGESIESVDTIFKKALEKISNKEEDKILTITEIEEIILESAMEVGLVSIFRAYKDYRDRRAEARRVLSIATKDEKGDTTDKALLIESDSKDIIGTWQRDKIAKQLEEEADLTHELAKDLSKLIENIVVDMYLRGVRKLRTSDIRAIVDMVLRQEGLENQRKKQALLGFPSSDFENMVISRSLENSNIASNNPEAVNLEIAERIQKQYALDNIFSHEVSQAHLNGKIHLHDLGYPTRVYCSSHSLEYLKKYGLNKVLANLEAKSSSPNSAQVLNQHVQTFLASMQSHYAGALGFGFLNIFYAPLINRPVDVLKIKLGEKEMIIEKRDLEKLIEQGAIDGKKIDIIYERKEMRELSIKEMLQVAQNLIFAASQNAFSRGGQTLFIDFNIHTGIPNYLKNVPAIGPGGKYMIAGKDGEIRMVEEVPRFSNKDDVNDSRNGDAAEIEDGKILTYGDFEKTTQKFAMAMLEVWRRGDRDGRPFHFPKCDLHVDENSFSIPDQKEVSDFAMQVAAENGSVYFMFDRGSEAVLAQCCRLKEKITDKTMLKYPERLRFCGFQNVTINLAQTAYNSQDIKEVKKKIDEAMELALKAHLQKATFMKKLLETDSSPMRNLGKLSDDGSPYIDLKKATYIVGLIGLNEAVQILTGKQLHEGEDAYKLGLEIIAYMYKKINEFKERTGLKFTLEETPAESTTRRLAKVDLQKFEQAKKIVKGSSEAPYYTNSIHFSPDADVGLIDRIVGQSKFHDLIESGAIIHAYIGEKRPNKETINYLVEKTLKDTRCSQLVFSPTYTECDECGNIMTGEKELCNNSGCSNSSKLTLDKTTLYSVTRIVGYYSRISHWNQSQKKIYDDRKKAEEYYAGSSGRDMSWMYNPSGNGKLLMIEFGKETCPNCKMLKEQVTRKIEEMKLGDYIDFKMIYLDKASDKEIAEAVLYDVPQDSVPTLVIAGKEGFWRKTMLYNSECGGACSVEKAKENVYIKPEEVEEEIKKMIAPFVQQSH